MASKPVSIGRSAGVALPHGPTAGTTARRPQPIRGGLSNVVHAIRPRYRGKGLGRVLVERILSEARTAGYGRIRLDTVEPVMKDAVAMYRRFGFRDIPPYRENPIEGAMYLELELNPE